MIRLIAVAFALALASAAQAMPPVPLQQLDDEMVLMVREGCGPGRVRGPAGGCVARTTIRQTRRAVRRCLRWEGSACRRWAD
jgi:hypothetical protein